MIISRHVEEVCHGRNNLRMLGSMLEAWIGALYFHEGEGGKGFEACQHWLIRIIDKYIDFTELTRTITSHISIEDFTITSLT
jgi:dsRNA-specific ribonuclease